MYSLSFLHAGEIHDAVKAVDVTKVEALLAADASLVNSKLDDGMTPLYLAVSVNSPELVKMLIKKGADVNVTTANGYTPLHWAAYKNAAEIASILLANGANTATATRDGYTPLHLAISEHAPDVLNVIITETQSVYSERFLEKHLALGDKAFRADELKSAHLMLTELLKHNPGNEKINFAYGLISYALGDYSRAKMTFERMLMANSKDGRARLELARTYLAAGQKELAREEFNAVLASNPPPQVAENIKEALKRLEKGPVKWRLSGKVDVGAFNDDNVNVGPDSDVISISPIIYGSLTLDELLLTSESQPVEADGLFLSVAASESYDLGKPRDWLLGLHCAYYQNWLDEVSEHENGFYQLGTSMRRVGQTSLLVFPLKVAHITSGGDALVTLYGTAPQLLYVAGTKKNMHWLTTGTVEARDYDTLNDRDGFYFSVGESLRNYFGEKRHNVSMEVNLFEDFTDASIYEHIGASWAVGASFNITKSIAAYGRLRYTRTDYKEKEILAPEDRVDSQDMLVFGVTRKISDAWSVDASFQTTQNDSTFGLYQYDRDVITIRTSFVF